MKTITHARLIDRLEFAADCTAVRERALQKLKEREAERQAKLKRWLSRPLPMRISRPVLGFPVLDVAPRFVAPVTPPKVVKTHKEKPGPKPRTITYRGETLTIQEWADRLDITKSTLLHRINRMGDAVAAVALGGRVPDQRTGGYQPTSKDSQGTGGGRHVRDLHSPEAQP